MDLKKKKKKKKLANNNNSTVAAPVPPSIYCRTRSKVAKCILTAVVIAKRPIIAENTKIRI
jgi:hypothetical protein